MKLQLTTLMIFLLTSAFAVKPRSQTADIITPGILKIECYYNIQNKIPNQVYLKDLDGQLIDSLFIPHDDYPRFTKDLEARVYHPNEPHYYVYLDSYPLENGQYKVFCNGKWHYINDVKGITKYMSWDKFITEILFFGTTAAKPLYSKPSVDSKALMFDYDTIYFQPKKVRGEWVYIDIFEGEEICNPIGHGWFRWREGNKFLIKKIYFSV